jgi:hypothetical protein
MNGPGLSKWSFANAAFDAFMPGSPFKDVLVPDDVTGVPKPIANFLTALGISFTPNTLQASLNSAISGVGNTISSTLNYLQTSNNVVSDLITLSTLSWNSFTNQIQSATCTYFWCNLIQANTISNISKTI